MIKGSKRQIDPLILTFISMRKSFKFKCTTLVKLSCSLKICLANLKQDNLPSLTPAPPVSKWLCRAWTKPRKEFLVKNKIEGSKSCHLLH